MKNFPTFTDHKTIMEAFRDWDMIDQMPKLSFPADMLIQIIPPFGGVAARFIATKEGSDTRVSVFFDVSNAMGTMSVPFWEIYPNADGDTERFPYSTPKMLIEAISKALESGR